MQSRVQSAAGKSNSPINTTLVARQQKAQPVNNTKSQSFDSKFNFDLSHISLSSPYRSSQTQPKINAKLGNENGLNQSEQETESEKPGTAIQRFSVLNKKLISRPKLKHSFKTIPVQPTLKVGIPPRNRLQQKITEPKEEASTEQLSTKTIPSPSTPSGDPGENNPELGKNQTSNISISVNDTAPPPPVQTKLTISTPGDKYEQEADTIAAKVIERINQPNFAPQVIARNTTRNQHLARRESPLTINPSKPKKLAHPIPNSTPWITRMAAVTTNRPKLSFHRNLEASIQRAKGGEKPLADKMEQAIGADFSEINIHTDSQGEGLNNAIQAKAFTTGQDIFFRQGEYNPENRSGQGLLAHELTHVVQQTGGQKVQKVQQKLSPHKLTDIVNDTALEPKSITTISAKANKIQFKVAEESSENTEAKQQEKPKPQKSEIETAKTQENQGEKSGTSEEKEASNKTEGSKKEHQQNSSAKTPTQEPQQTKKTPKTSTGSQAGDASVLGEAKTDTEPKGETKAKAPTSPEADPAFQAVVGKAKKVAQQEKQHEPAKTKANQAQAAAVAPPSEVESKGQANQMGEMEQAETPGFDKVAFKNKLMERITETAPKNLEDADNFKDNNKLESVKGELSGKVKEEQEGSQKPLEDKSKEAPDTSGIEPKPVTPLPPTQPGAAPAGVGAEGAVPKSKGKGEVEAPLQENSKQLDQKMAGADVTEEQLAKSNEPQFKAALTAKKDAKSDASQAPQAYRQSEEAELSQAQGEAVANSEGKLQGMHGDRAKLLTQVVGKQTEGKGKDEQSRAKVAGDIQQIYSETKTKVESILSGLDTKVETAFDTGAAKAKQLFEDHVDKHMSAYKDKRYSGVIGAGRWLKDKLLGMPSEVNKFYEAAKNLYLKEMDRVIDQVVNIIGDGLSQAKSEVANGRKRVQNYVNQLPANLKSIGQEAASDIQSEFDSLEESVDAKQDELIDKLAQKYQENVQALDARIEEMKAANQGLVDKAANYISGVIETINKLKEMLTKVLAKVADVVGKIIQDPIGFLGNLVKGLKQGFDNFAGNIGKHLQAGLIGWLTGAMGGVGIQIPDDIFSLKGIFNLVMQILGLTWDYIRKKAVKLFGARVVAAMETGSEVFQALMEGPEALWEYVKGQFGDLKETVIGAIKEMVITQVITAGIKWILGLLNPAGAFIKAAMAIYEIIMFFVNNAARIIDLINAIVDAVGAIARGAIGAAAKLVENALAKALPVVIGFLASLLGVSGLAKKVQAIVKKVRKRIDKAIDKMLMKAKKAVKKLFKGKKGKGKNGKETDPEHERKVQAGLAAIDREEQKYLKGGDISREDAEKVAVTVKKSHPVFKSITVVDGGNTWDYDYVASPGKKKKGEKKQIGKHQSKYVTRENGQYMLKKEYRNKQFTRDQCYGKSYRPSVNQWKQQMLSTPRNHGGLRHPTQHNKYWYDGKYYENTGNTIATIDHDPMVVEHWNNIGRKTTQNIRKDYFNGGGSVHLTIVPLSINSSLGSSAGQNYNYRVTKDFRGPKE